MFKISENIALELSDAMKIEGLEIVNMELSNKFLKPKALGQSYHKLLP